MRQPFFCNAAAQAAAIEALNHQDEVARRVERNLAERIGLEDGPARARHRARGVAGQLRLVRPARRGRATASARSCRALAERGVLVRAGGALGRAGALRVTVGTEAENERFLDALGALL